jgi:hypothetical protein
VSTPFNGLDVAGTGQRIKDWVIARFEDSSQPLPERRYCAPGDPRTIAWDCEQFVVALGGIGWGQALDESSASARTGTPVSVMGMRHAVYTLQIVRCTPQPDATKREKLPSVEALDAAGLTYMRDAGLLSQALLTFAADMAQHLGREALVQCGVIEPVGPDGGFHAAEGTITITVGALT